MTDYKCQSKTYSKAIIDLTAPAVGRTDTNSAYVMISRFRSLDGMLILRDFDGNARINSKMVPNLLRQYQHEKSVDLARPRHAQ